MLASSWVAGIHEINGARISRQAHRGFGHHSMGQQTGHETNLILRPGAEVSV